MQDDASDSNQTQKLVDQARSGDQEAARQLMVLYHPRLRARLVRQMDATMKSKVEPEDILQQVYMEAFRAIDSFEYNGKDSFLRWMYAILDRKLIDQHRALHADRRDVRRERKPPARQSPNQSYVDLLGRLSAETGTPSQIIRKEEAVGILMTCIASLPDHYRDVVQMRFIEGRPVTDVAEVLGRSIGSVHMICHRALRQLRQIVERHGVRWDE